MAARFRVAAHSRHVALAVRIFAVAVAYYVAGVLGLRLALVGGQVTPLWPPTGIALAALLLLGIRAWPGITLGALAINIPLGPSPPAVALIAAGNTLAPICAYLLLTRTGFRIDLDRLKDTLALVFLGAFTAMLISATIGSSALLLAGAIPASHFLATWSVWWTGATMGVLTVTPLILVARKIRLPQRVNPYRAAEAVALIGATFAVTLLVMNVTEHLLFLSFPFLIWAALRFHHAGAVLAALVVSSVTILAAARGSPAFTGLDLTRTMINLQAYNGTMALTALILATVTVQRDLARKEIDQAVVQLAEAVGLLREGGPLQGRLLQVVQRLPAKRPPGS